MNYTVTFEDDGRYYVKGFDNEKGFHFDYKGSAVARAIELCKNAGGSYVLVYGTHGKITDKLPC